MSAILQSWRVIFDQIKEIELTVMLNNVTDGAITLRIKEAVKLANLVQIAFDDQYQRLRPNKIKITTTINAKIRQIGAVLADLITFVPPTAQKFARLIQSTRRNIDILLTEFQFKLPSGGRQASRSRSQLTRQLLNNYSVRNEYQAYDRSGSNMAGAKAGRHITKSRYDPLQDKQLANLRHTLREIEQDQIMQQDLINQTKTSDFAAKLEDIKNSYKQQNFLLKEDMQRKDEEIAYLKAKLEQVQQVDDRRRDLVESLNIENQGLKDKITVLQNQCILGENQLNQKQMQIEEERRELNLQIEKHKSHAQAVERQLGGLSHLLYKEQYKNSALPSPDLDDMKREFLEQVELMKEGQNFDNIDLVAEIFVSNVIDAVTQRHQQGERFGSNKEKLAGMFQKRFEELGGSSNK